MTSKKIRAIGAGVLVAVWIVLTGFAWFAPAKDVSEAERRPLAQFPTLNAETLFNGKFMGNFEDFTLDQFPGRDAFRQLKSLFHYYVLNQKDNNGIYIVDDYAAKLDFPMNQESVDYAMRRFNLIYEKYLKDTGSKIYTTVVPDKGYYLADKNGYPTMDYNKLFETVKDKMSWAEFVDITDCLDITDYYYTDTHWRQEKLLEVAQRLSAALGVTAPKAEDFTQTLIERPFYGVYYGQAALPMEPENLYVMQSQLLQACKVYDFETDSYVDVYDMTKLNNKDLYDIFLSGMKSMLRIENPNATTDRELIVFRDSFGSSITPLLVQDYETVTVVDIRYVSPMLLKNFLEFNGQDVLFLYSSLVLNSSNQIK